MIPYSLMLCCAPPTFPGSSHAGRFSLPSRLLRLSGFGRAGSHARPAGLPPGFWTFAYPKFRNCPLNSPVVSFSASDLIPGRRRPSAFFALLEQLGARKLLENIDVDLIVLG